MANYDAQVATATRLIQEKGKMVWIVRQNVNLVPGAPWEAPFLNEVVETASAVFLPVGRVGRESQTTRDRSPESASEHMQVLIAGRGAAPTIHDKIRDASGDWAILSVETLSPSGQDILYTLEVAR